MSRKEMEHSSERQNKPDVRHRDQDGGWAWTVLAFTCVFQVIVGLVYTMGLFNIMFLEEFGESKQTTAWVGSTLSCSALIYSPLAAFIHDRVGGRITVLIGTLIAFTGCLLASFARNFIWLFMTFGVTFGLGSGISYIAWVLAIGAYFQKYRNFAYGLASGSAGLGIMILSPLIQFLAREFGWRGCIFIVSAIYLNNLAVALVLRSPRKNRSGEEKDELDMEVESKLRKSQLRRNDCVTSSIISLASIGSKTSSKYDYPGCPKSPRPIDSGEGLNDKNLTQSSTAVNGLETISKPQRKEVPLLNQGNEEEEPIEIEGIPIASENSKRQKLRRIFGNPKIVVYYLNLMCTHGSTILVYVHFPEVFRLEGASDSDLSTIMVISGVASMFSRALVGLASNSKDIGVLILYFGCGIISGAFMVLCPFLAKSFSGQMLFSLFFSFYGNAYNSLMPGMALELCTLEDLSTAYGIACLMCGIGGIVGPPFGGWLYDVSGSYNVTFYAAGALCTAASLSMLLIPVLGSESADHQNTPQEKRQETSC